MGFLVAGLAFAPTARGAEPVSGARFDALAAGAVDVMRLHHWTLKAQMDRGEVEGMYEASLHSAKADFVDTDGAVIRSDLARLLATYWFGAGDPREGHAWFTGLQVDGAFVGSGSLGSLPYVGELLLFGGTRGRAGRGRSGSAGTTTRASTTTAPSSRGCRSRAGRGTTPTAAAPA